MVATLKDEWKKIMILVHHWYMSVVVCMSVGA